MRCIFGSKTSQEPERPTIHYHEPTMVTHAIKMKTRGKYRTKSGMPKGLIVHYTAGRNNGGGTIASMAKRGLGCLVMTEDGTIHQSNHQKINQVAYHAGTSEKYGVKGLSFYCMGMEICNAGLLEAKGDKFVSWFGEKYDRDEVRTVQKSSGGYLRGGDYHKYTKAQEDALINFCLWQKATNPEFDFDWVLGHDEVASPRGRKSDPGGSLSMPMPALRQKLKDMWDQI